MYTYSFYVPGSLLLIMSTDFLDLNGKIWDAQEYQRKLILVKRHLQYRLQQELFIEGFAMKKGHDSNALGSELTFYNEHLDLELIVKVRKKSKWVWV